MGARRSGAFHDYAISVFREQGTRWRKLRPSQARGLRRFGLRRSKSEAEQRWENEGGSTDLLARWTCSAW
jgi:hypothetical protein